MPVFGAGYWPAGEHLPANKVQDVTDHLDEAWTTYTIGMTASGGGLNIGSSTRSAKYKRLGSLVTVAFRFSATIGGAFNAGSGGWLFGLPINAVGTPAALGHGYVQDGGTVRLAVCVLNSATAFEVYFNNAAATAAVVGSSGPGSAWATGDVVAGMFTYEVT